MRKLVVSNMITVDGYYEDKGGGFSTLYKYFHEDYHGDGTFDQYNVDMLRQADTMLFGARTFSGWNDYWHKVPNDPNTSAIRHEYARLVNPMPKVVVSDTLTDADVARWGNVRVVKRADAHEAIAALKAQDGRDITISGSRTLWLDLLERGLVDEVHLSIIPMIAGEGVLLFDRQPSVYLKLIEARTWQGSGVVMTRYAVSKK